MASSLAAQLSQIAAKSTNPLDLKAQRVAHSQSLIFEKKIAISQDFDTIYEICYEGFQELCLLDARFTEFGRTIFSEQSKAEERTQMTAAQNKELDAVLESFLALVGSKLLLSPAIKAVEWLVRRFRVHEYNTAFLLLTFLPYHSTPVFLNLLAILPEDLTPTFKVLYPYKRSLINPPRHPLVHSAATNQAFCSALNRYVLEVSKQHAHYHGLLAFWAGIMTEAVSGMLDSARSGRRGVEMQKHEDILLRFLPVLNDGFALKKVPELVIGCYMLAVVFATKAALQDNVLDTLMEAVVGSWTQETMSSGIVCLAVLAQHKEDVKLPKKVLRSVLRLENPVGLLAEVKAQHQVSQLVLGLVSGCLSDLEKQDAQSRLDFISRIFEKGLLDESGNRKAITMILQASSDAHKKGEMSLDIQTRFSELVQGLNSSDTLRPLLQAATSESAIDVASLEHSLQTVIEKQPALPPSEDVEMKDADEEEEADAFPELAKSLAKESRYPSSFLDDQKSPVFDKLVQALTLAAGSEERLDTFSNLPVLGKAHTTDKPQFLSFFIRVFSGPHPVSARAAALTIMASSLPSDKTTAVDLQGLLPYVIAALSDPSAKIRREAANLVAAIAELYRKAKKKDSDTGSPWAHDSLYTQKTQSQSVQWLSTRDAHKFVDRVLLPGLEEYVLDAGHIGAAIESALKGSSSSENADSDKTELKKSLRLSIFGFLCSHVVHTPLYGVKLRLLKIINRVDRIGSHTRTRELLPLLEKWRTLTQEEVVGICEREHISAAELEQEVVAIVSHKDKEAVDILVSDVNKARLPFLSAVFARIQAIWAKIGEDRQFSASDKLLQLSVEGSDGNEAVQTNAKNTLRSVELPGTALLDLIEKIPASIESLESHAPSPKRRRTNQNNAVAMQSELSKVMEKVTFILELVDSSAPENHPELADGLFKTLAALHNFKSQIQSGLGYLLSLTLGSLLAIVNKSRASSKPQFDTSVIRTDLVVDCVRTTESPQVQNTALLLVSGLAVIAPELVLHSVMPIFTFMGSSVLRKDDEYSVLVIDQTIDQVVPALVQSLRNQKRDVVSGTSELLLSFTAAFEHIPSHRRQRLFEALVTKLGTQDFLFAVLAMLANRYALDKDVCSLMTGLVVNIGAELQLLTYKKYLDLVSDSLQPKPGISQVLLGVGNDGASDPHKVAEVLLRSLAYLLKHSSLGSKMGVVYTSDDKDAAANIRVLFSQILEQILTLADAVQDNKALSWVCGDVLGAVLGTLSLVDFLDTVEELLKRPNDELRRKVLRLLESRVRQNPERDTASQNRVLEFVSVLVDIIQTSPDILLKHAAVACVDRISEKYGKKDTGRVVHAAQVVAGEACLGQSDDRIRVMGVLCLASMAEVLGQAIIPALPEALRRSLGLLETSLKEGEENEKLHNAVFSLLSALFVQVPFMLSDKHLDRILQLSFMSAKASLSGDADDARQEMLKLLARKADVKESFSAVERNWAFAVQQGPTAVREVLDVIRIAIEKHPKSSTVKNVGILSKFFHKAFDLRREQVCSDEFQYEESELEDIENIISEVAIKMIYKLNDTSFRPIFIEFVEWATNGLPKKDALGRTMRLTSFYKFLQSFFGTLKSIVTSYASYIIDNVVEVLKSAKPTDKDSKSLWLAAIRTLRYAFEHDQDEFWQSPSHLAAISTPLISQLSRATNASTAAIIISEAVPTITELAVAADSPDNHKELNTAIMKYLRPSSTTSSGERVIAGESPHTRLAALKAEQSLTERLGEEWLALLPEMLPYISELMEDEDETVEREVRKWVKEIESILGEKLDDMLT
ncbi:hypothetical protein VTN77DRAFT_528 [Rasamsonia byssochlamydoides]|uniref:uncharacterized protein n=1 Tax=Rasamsonia byssochlamydoides TaxID=89139 RepID=UPI0037436787